MSLCDVRSRKEGEPLPHEDDVIEGEIGDNGYAHETWKCVHCGRVAAEYTPEEVEQEHVTDLILAGEVDWDTLTVEPGEVDYIDEAFARREETA